MIPLDDCTPAKACEDRKPGLLGRVAGTRSAAHVPLLTAAWDEHVGDGMQLATSPDLKTWTPFELVLVKVPPQ
jgi:hypothetical protein